MQAEYDLTEQDLSAFQRYHGKHLPAGARRNPNAVLGWLLLAAGIVMIVFVLTFNTSLIGYDGWLLVAGAYGALMGVGATRLYARFMGPSMARKALRQGRNAEKLFGWRRISIDAEAVRSTSDFASSTFLWHGIDRIAATPDHAFFYVTTTTALMVPRAAFPNDRAFDDFVEAARRYHRIGEINREPAGGRAWDHRPATGIVAPALPSEPPVEEGIVRKNEPRP